jgi:hypothetical protein
LLVGPRPDGSSYGKDEIEALEEVIPALRRSLLAALEREKDRRRVQEFQRNVNATLAGLSARVEAIEVATSR